MGGRLVAGLPHLCWTGGIGCQPLLLLPQRDAQGETRASLKAEGLGWCRVHCQQGKYPHVLATAQAPEPTTMLPDRGVILPEQVPLPAPNRPAQ